MVTFFISLAILVLGYMLYGSFVEKVFGADADRPTPAVTMEDGVDYVPMHPARIFLIQFLNIAGLGPIFGAIAGALWGPVAFLWIVLGTLFAGAVHDYFSGMLSVRHKGASISEVVGIYLGPVMKQVMRAFSVVLLLLVGIVFVLGPAKLLATISPLSVSVWVVLIFLYYFAATMLPIDQLIGRIYPLFGAALLFMAVGIAGALIIGGYQMPELTLANLHPKSLPIWPLMFITIACGAISGFHSTQSPMMARCITNEKQGRKVFYGAMVAEGVVALIWAAAAMTFFHGTGGLAGALAKGGPGAVVYTVCTTLLGGFGGVLAMVGVIACPITSGDTAFRSARLTIADFLNKSQTTIPSRLLIAVPCFILGAIVCQVNFAIIWRYFAWTNQTLAMFVLWSAAVYMYEKGKLHWIASLPATFMTAVSVTYILQAPEGLKLSTSISYPVGIAVALAVFTLFMIKCRRVENLEEEPVEEAAS
jgi:carbon starvation protein CstA